MIYNYKQNILSLSGKQSKKHNRQKRGNNISRQKDFIIINCDITQAIHHSLTCLTLLRNKDISSFTHKHHIICTSSHHNLKHYGTSKIRANAKTHVKCSTFSEVRNDFSVSIFLFLLLKIPMLHFKTNWEKTPSQTPFVKHNHFFFFFSVFFFLFQVFQGHKKKNKKNK